MCYSNKPGEKTKMLPCAGTCRKEDRCKTALEQVPALAGSRTESSMASSGETLFEIETLSHQNQEAMLVGQLTA